MRKMLQSNSSNIKRLFQILLTAVLLIPFSYGQTTVTIGSGTSITPNLPINASFGYSYSQQIYTQAQVNSIGNIEKIRFYWSSGTVTNSSAWVIYMGHTTKTSFNSTSDWIQASSLSEVFNGDVTFPGSAGWMEITLNTPFEYNNVDNLVIAIDENTSGDAVFSVNWRSFRSGANTGIYYRSDDINPTPSSPPTASSNSSSINQIQLEFSPSSAMTFTSSTTTQRNTTAVRAGTTSQVVLGVEVVTAGNTSPISITNFNFNILGTTSTGDISNARVYSTGSSSTFAAGTQYGNTILSPNGTFSVSGSQVLGIGTNYFWLTYDIVSGANDGNVIDAICESITVDAADYTPSVTAPVGSRTIRQLFSGTKIIAATGGHYTNLGTAISDLNSIGVGAGGVIFTLADGETFNELSNINISTSGTLENPIIIKQSGSGSKPILSFTGTSSIDACIKFNQVSYVTLDGLQIVDAMATNKVKYGLYFFGNLSVGSQYNIIKNCVIDLDKSNTSSTGVYFYNRASSTTGTNSNNKFYNNTVQDCYSAYEFNGNSTYYDIGNEVNIINGGTSIVTNIGGSSVSVYAVQVAYQQSFVFSNTTLSNVSGTRSVYGIYQSSGGSSTVTFSKNTITNLNSTSTSNPVYGIYSGTGSNVNITQNDINTLTGSSTSTSTPIYGIYSAYGTTNVIDSNSVHGISGTTHVYGISVGGGTTNTIKRNKIYSINSTGPNIAYGLDLSSGSTNYIYNNMIYDIKAAASTAIPGVRALSLSGGENAFVFYNSVLVDYVSTVASNQSAALYVTTSPTMLAMSNNIFINKSDMTIGSRAVAFCKSSTSLVNLSLNNNNNLFYAGVPSSKNLLFYDGTNTDQTLATFKARMGTKESSSVTENAPFISSSNLQINPAVGTQIESGGQRITTPLAIIDDIDANIRLGEAGYAGTGTAPDIGADEGNFIYADLTVPTIIFTDLGNSSNTTTNNLANVTITDASGINVLPGTAPRLYYKKSTDDNAFAGNTYGDNGWKWVESASGSSPFSFEFDYSILYNGPAAGGDIIQYFVVAQDNAGSPNVGIYSGSFNTTPASVDLYSGVSPIGETVKSFTIIGSISGTKTVGALGADYASINAAISALSEAEITGPVVLNLIDATYTESVTIPVLLGSSSTNTVTIKPASGKTVIWTSASTTSGTLRLNGADYIIVDGSNNGTTSRDITISNTATATFSVPVWISSLGTGAGASNITIKNCNLKGGSTSLTTSYGVFIAGQTLSATGTGDDNDNISIQNNIITRAYTGIYAKASVTGINNSLTVLGNTIGSSTSTEFIGRYGINLSFATGSTVSNNTIFGVSSTLGNAFGIAAGTGVLNTSINANKIFEIKYTGISAYSGIGIDVNTGNNSSALTISNNILYNLTGTGYFIDNDAVVGIRIMGSTGGVNIWYNAINLYGNCSVGWTNSAALYIYSQVTNLDIRNNILANSIVNTSGNGYSSKAYAIFSNAQNIAFTQINNNIYYTSGFQGVLGYLGADKTTLSSWQTATGNDAGSIVAEPTFVSYDNLKILFGSPAINAGLTVSVTTDFEGRARSESTPSIGAYESAYTPPTVEWANLHYPSTLTFSEGNNGTAYAQVYKSGVTEPAGQGAGIQVWIGYGPTGTNPNTWSNWTAATFHIQSGNYDEYKASIGNSIRTGTYDYASRIQYLDGIYQYGGYSAGGGNFWDGVAYISGVLSVSPFIANVPYIQNFDGVTSPALPVGWTVFDADHNSKNWENANWSPRTPLNSMIQRGSNDVVNDWFFTPGINLQAGVTYEISFYYKAESASHPEKLEVKWGSAPSVAGMTSNAIFSNIDIVNTIYTKGTATFTALSSGVYYMGWHCFSDRFKWYLYVDDVLVTVNPIATNAQTIAAGSTSIFTFTDTGAQIQFTTGNTGSIDLLFEKIPANPLGALPSGLTNLANTYWTGTVSTGTVDGTYSITFDLTGILGVGDLSRVHLVKRSDPNGTWIDEGVADIVNGLQLTWGGLNSFSDFALADGDNPLPVELVNFTAKAKNRNVILNWETKTEIDNLGFEVERKDKSGQWMKAAFIEGHGTSNAPKYYSFEDKKLSSGKHFYRLKQIDNDGKFDYCDEVEVTIELPTEFALSQNYPNPFNPTTKVDYQLAENARVTVELYGMTGERVALLLSEEQDAGYYSIMIDAYKHQLASGIYMYRMTAIDALGRNFIATKKLSLIK